MGIVCEKTVRTHAAHDLLARVCYGRNSRYGGEMAEPKLRTDFAAVDFGRITPLNPLRNILTAGKEGTNRVVRFFRYA